MNVGDATFHFLGDTTNLDEAFDRLENDTPGKIDKATAAFKGTSAAVDEVSHSMEVGQQGATELKDVVSLAGSTMKGSMYEARGELGLIDEMIGVRLPRHVVSFVAELPGVGSALSAAFQATAIVFLLEALVKVSEKLSSFVADTFVFTEAMKESDKATIKANQTLLAHADAINKAKQAIEDYGLTATQKTQKAIDGNNSAWADNTAKIRLNREEAAKLAEEQSGVANALGQTGTKVLNSITEWAAWSLGLESSKFQIKDNTAKIQELGDEFNILTQAQKENAAQLILLNLQLRDEEDAARKKSVTQQAAFNQTRLSSEETVGKALLNLQKSQTDAAVAFGDESGVKRLIIDRAFAEAEYQLALSTEKRKLADREQAESQLFQIEKANLDNRLAVQKAMGDAGKSGVAATQVQIEELAKQHGIKLSEIALSGNAQIEAREKQHEAQMINDAKKFDNDFQQIIKDTFSAKGERQGEGFAASLLGTDFNDRFKQAEAAAKALGVTLAGTLAQDTAKANTAFKNMQTLQKEGVVSALDLAKAQLVVEKSKLALDKAMGNTTAIKADEKAIADTIKTIQKMEGEVPKLKSGWDTFTSDFKKKAKELSSESQTMGKMVADSAFQMEHAFETAMTSAILSESSFGDALKKGTAQVLAQLSAQAAVHAIYSLALGFLKEAQYDFAGAQLAFTAAAEFGLLAGAAGAAGHALAGGGSNAGSSGGTSPTNTTGTAATTPATNSPQGINIPHLESGGLITAPTLAMLGESNRREAVLPLTDNNAMSMIADAISKHLGESGGGAGGTNFYINGMVSSDTVGKMAKKLSRQVQTGRTRLTASNTHKITRRGI